MTQPATREELIARLENLDARAKAVQAQLQPSGIKWGRVLFLLGVPIGAGIAIGYATHSILFGIVGGVGAVIAVGVLASKLWPTPAHMKMGTRAWEAKLTADLLVRTIEQRRQQKQLAADPAKREYLEREISFLCKQVDTNTAIYLSGDASPGKGHVGFDPYDGP